MYSKPDHIWTYYGNFSHFRPDIRSAAARARYMLTEYTYIAHRLPNDWKLLCRYANTVEDKGALYDLRQLAEYFKNHALGVMCGPNYLTVVIQAEEEIIRRTAPEYAAGQGHDITDAVSFLQKSERSDRPLSQGCRNLILSYAYFFGSSAAIARFADNVAANRFSNQDIVSACIDIEAINLQWAGLDRMKGIEMITEERPTFQFSFNDVEKDTCPRFAMFQDSMPEGTVLLPNGVILNRCLDDWERWESALQKIDGTFTAPRYYIQTGKECFKAAERVEEVHDLEEAQDSKIILPPIKMAKPSIQEKLQNAMQEVAHRPPSAEKSKDNGAR